MGVVYFFWSLIPVVFFLLAAWSVVKPYLKVAGREFGGNYLRQGLFCLGALAIALFIDRLEVYENLLTNLSFWKFDLNKMRWLLYPLILVALASAQQMMTKKEKKPKPIPRRY